jgi:hypothetical protein
MIEHRIREAVLSAATPATGIAEKGDLAGLRFNRSVRANSVRVDQCLTQREELRRGAANYLPGRLERRSGDGTQLPA